MISIDKSSYFWLYLSPGQQGLIEEGLYLLEDIKTHPDAHITDYSYLIFPFAKAYEGFLKQLFLNQNFISDQDYESDHFRIGKILNPHLRKMLGRDSVYQKIVEYCKSEDLANTLWNVWKIGRNRIFHYFPHNLTALSYDQAENIVSQILTTMEESVEVFRNK